MGALFVKTELLLCTSTTLEAGFVSPVHSHKFWQAEILKKGRGWVVAGGEKKILKESDIFIIPPGVVHHFNYDHTSDIVCVRFNASVDKGLAGEAFSIRERPLKNIINLVLFELAKNSDSLSNAEKVFMEYLLASIISIHYSSPVNNFLDKLPSALEKAMNFIEKNKGCQIFSPEVARTAGCSQGYLSALFRKHHGMSLKRFIDRARAEYIKQYLLYSDMSITEIADFLGFEDIYTFSRFFKRLEGVSPNACRKASMDF